MNDQRKTKAQLIQELNDLRQRFDAGGNSDINAPMDTWGLPLLYEQIVSSSTDMLACLDKNFVYLAANKAYLKAFGKHSHELLGRTPADIFGEDFFNMVIKPHAVRCLAGEKVNYQEWIEFADSGPKYMDVNYIPFVGNNNQIRGFAVNGRDITDRKKAEEDLIASMERSRLLFESANDAIMVNRPQAEGQPGRFVEVNEVACRRLGYSREELSQLSPVDISVTEQAAFKDIMGKLFSERKVIFETIHKRKDGAEFPVEVSAHLFELEGRPAILSIARDITERKQAEEKLRKSEENLRNLYDNSIEGIFSIKLDGTFLFVNPAMVIIFGYDSVDDLLKTSANDLYVQTEPGEETTQLYEQYVHAKGLELEMLRKDKSKLWVRMSSTAVVDEKGNTICYEGFISNISESKKLEQELIKTKKLESVGLLAGGLAHDFNNALATIQLSASLATLDKNMSPKTIESLEAIEQTVTRATGITHQLLTFSKGGAPVTAPTDMRLLIKDAVLLALSGTNVSPIFDIDEALHYSDVDPNQINQVVNNLIINARHAMSRRGGTLKIIASNVTVSEDHQLGPLKNGNYVCISVQDQGHGIEPDNLDKIFDPYFTTKEFGSGLGLFSCYSVIDKHDGWITAESEIGVGSELTFYLPESCAVLPEPVDDRTELVPQEDSSRAGRILIMDDELSLRTSLSVLLEAMGYIASHSADGEEAIRLYSEALETGTPFDLVILDLTVPAGLGGRETIKRLKEIDPAVSAIVSSGYSNDTVVLNYKDHGFDGVLPKPYKIDLLVQVVKDTIEQGK